MAVRIAESPTGLSFEPEPPIKSPSKHSMWQKFNLSKFFTKDGRTDRQEPPVPQWTTDIPQGLRRNWSRKVGVGLPRPATFKRQNSERREHLEPVSTSQVEKRALSQNRQRAFSLQRPRARSSPPPFPLPRTSAPAVTHSNDFPELSHANTAPIHSEEADELPDFLDGLGNELQKAPSQTFSDEPPPSIYGNDDRDQFNAELDSRWILNLSMHFRDKSDREKFFITYAQEPNLWRRVTVSCDYRRAEPDSLETDLKELQFQRDKSAQIYEAIRDSLPDIQFYDTVTNLKLETTEGRLHVHVTEDVNEIIPYPPISSVSHLEDARIVRESEIAFDSHLSGFVYRVTHRNQDFIKKEIPGPDTVDEFLYEMNALYSVRGSNCVIDFKGIIVDDQRKFVKGVLIDFAEQGALVDLIYDHKGKLSMDRRLRWARQAIEGVEEIHEGGFVQGDLTLSNIVIDGRDNAKIIDINRRGCPVGWEPPEIRAKIASNQRISMYIGVKSDLFQLGMTLWGIAAQEDEPERCDRPLDIEGPLASFPPWYRQIIRICLSERPQDRLSAKELRTLFPTEQPAIPEYLYNSTSSVSGRQKRYIEPSAAVEREDLERFGSVSPRHRSYSPAERQSIGDTLIPAPSKTYRGDSSDSIIDISKHSRRPHDDNYSPFEERGRRRSRDDEIEVMLEEDSDAEAHIISVSPDMNQQHAEIVLDGTPYIIERSAFDPEDLKVLEDKLNETEQPSQSSTQDWADVSKGPQNQLLSNGLDYRVDNQPTSSRIRQSTGSESSQTSQSTPKNALPSYTSTDPSTVSSSSMNDDLACCGVNPTLEEHCSHEPNIGGKSSAQKSPLESITGEPSYFQGRKNFLMRKDSGGNSVARSYEKPLETAPSVSSEQTVSLTNGLDHAQEISESSSLDFNQHQVSGNNTSGPQSQKGPPPKERNAAPTVSPPASTEFSSGYSDAAPPNLETEILPVDSTPETQRPFPLNTDADSITSLPTILVESPNSAKTMPSQQSPD